MPRAVRVTRYTPAGQNRTWWEELPDDATMDDYRKVVEPVVGGPPVLIDVANHKLCLWISETSALDQPFNRIATDRLWATFAEANDVIALFCERNIPEVYGVAVVIEEPLPDGAASA